MIEGSAMGVFNNIMDKTESQQDKKKKKVGLRNLGNWIKIGSVSLLMLANVLDSEPAQTDVSPFNPSHVASHSKIPPLEKRLASDVTGRIYFPNGEGANAHLEFKSQGSGTTYNTDTDPITGAYTLNTTSVDNRTQEIPDALRLYSNGPNPFEGRTNITFDHQQGYVPSVLYGPQGQQIPISPDKLIGAKSMGMPLDSRIEIDKIVLPARQ